MCVLVENTTTPGARPRNLKINSDRSRSETGPSLKYKKGPCPMWPRPISEKATRPNSETGPRPNSEKGPRPMSEKGLRPNSETGARPNSEKGPRPMSEKGPCPMWPCPMSEKGPRLVRSRPMWPRPLPRTGPCPISEKVSQTGRTENVKNKRQRDREPSRVSIKSVLKTMKTKRKRNKVKFFSRLYPSSSVMHKMQTIKNIGFGNIRTGLTAFPITITIPDLA